MLARSLQLLYNFARVLEGRIPCPTTSLKRRTGEHPLKEEFLWITLFSKLHANTASSIEFQMDGSYPHRLLSGNEGESGKRGTYKRRHNAVPGSHAGEMLKSCMPRAFDYRAVDYSRKVSQANWHIGGRNLAGLDSANMKTLKTRARVSIQSLRQALCGFACSVCIFLLPRPAKHRNNSLDQICRMLQGQIWFSKAWWMP